MLNYVRDFLLYWLISYFVFSTIYLVFGYIVTVMNRRLLGDAYKIQKRNPQSWEIKRDIKQSLKSLISISFFLAFAVYVQKIGLTMQPLVGKWYYYVFMFIVSMVVFDTWFSWDHRFTHSKLIYRRVHKWHHQPITPSVWSNNSDTFIDNCLAQSYFLLATFFLPIPASVLITHKIFEQMQAMLGHAGYEYAPGKFSRFPSPLVGVSFHDRHHSKFNYNFASHFSIWDRLMKTLDPVYDKEIMEFGKQKTLPAKKEVLNYD